MGCPGMLPPRQGGQKVGEVRQMARGLLRPPGAAVRRCGASSHGRGDAGADLWGREVPRKSGGGGWSGCAAGADPVRRPSRPEQRLSGHRSALPQRRAGADVHPQGPDAAHQRGPPAVPGLGPVAGGADGHHHRQRGRVRFDAAQEPAGRRAGGPAAPHPERGCEGGAGHPEGPRYGLLQGRHPGPAAAGRQRGRDPHGDRQLPRGRRAGRPAGPLQRRHEGGPAPRAVHREVHRKGDAAAR
mmetsp:Transcript_15545/g.27579  ORF Transcript_15545/g.27579 Transcript_15545/m.27579 type:complete len:242 (-) Transcript_15545:270-995(-)